MILSEDLNVLGRVHDHCASIYVYLNPERKHLYANVESPSACLQAEWFKDKLIDAIHNMPVDLVLDPVGMLKYINYPSQGPKIDAISLRVNGSGSTIRYYNFGLWVRKEHRQTMMFLGTFEICVHLLGTPFDYALRSWSDKCDPWFNQLFPSKFGVRYAYINKPNIFHIKCRS